MLVGRTPTRASRPSNLQFLISSPVIRTCPPTAGPTIVRILRSGPHDFLIASSFALSLPQRPKGVVGIPGSNRRPPMFFLIGPPVIRIRPKPRRISGPIKSNRRLLHAGQICGRCESRPCRSALATNHSSLTTEFLIGSPVIRIRAKPCRISSQTDSNRREIADAMSIGILRATPSNSRRPKDPGSSFQPQAFQPAIFNRLSRY
jgi:hypothetical protein